VQGYLQDLTSEAAVRMVRVVHDPSGKILADKAKVAENVANRALGLLVTSELKPGEGLWLLPSTGIHTFGMTYSLDVIMLDREHHVSRMDTEVKPFRVLWKPGLEVHSVLELPSGTIAGCDIQVGDFLRMIELEEE